jgi:hypothetical protein
MKVEFRQGDDWAELVVDGKSRYANHSIPDFEFLEIIRELGAAVTEPRGDFCGCGDWVAQGKRCEVC